MHTARTALAAAFAGLLALGAQAPAQAATPAHDHAQAAAAPAALTLDHGRKWTTDAPLRQRMGEIRALLAPRLGAIHRGTLTAADYRALGVAVEQKVAAIVAECKLPPEADAMLHLVVADLVAGADTMQGKAPGTAAEGAHRVATAANAYGRHFDHPGWKPLG